MKIKNKHLPISLAGTNSGEYMHDTDRYKLSNFTMHLANGAYWNCRVWAEKVENWFDSLSDEDKLRLGEREDEENVAEKLRRIKESTARKMAEEALAKMRTTEETNMYHEVVNGTTKYSFTPRPVNTTFFDNGYVCIVDWSDGTKTKVIWDGEGEYSPELGMAIALIKKFHGLSMYDQLLNSVDANKKAQEAEKQRRREELAEEERQRARRYRKAVKREAKRREKKERFNADVRNEMNNQFI